MKSSKQDPLFFQFTFEFLEIYLPNRLGRSAHTIESIRDTLTIFRRFLLDEKQISISGFRFSDCDRNIVFEFLAHLKEKGNADSTRNHRLAGMKTYLAFAAIEDVALQSIYLRIAKIPPVRKIKDEKQILSESQVASIISQSPEGLIGFRNKTMLLVLYETGLRVSELVSLKIDNLYLNREYPYIHVLGKGRRERQIAITSDLANFLEIYKSHLLTPDVADSGILFFTIRKGSVDMMTTRNVELFLRDYAKKARKVDSTIPDKVYPHMLRRSKATTLYQNGMPLELVSSFLGHSQLETTRIYAKPSLELMRSKIEQVSLDLGCVESPTWFGNEVKLAHKCGLR